MNMTQKVIIGLILALLAVGCSSSRDDTLNYKERTSINSKAARISLLRNKIARHDIQILESSTSMLVILPGGEIFNRDSATLSFRAYDALDLVAELLNYYDIAVVSVTGFSNNDDDNPLAVGRAHTVAKYLWDQGIDASLIYSQSYDLSLMPSDTIIEDGSVVINFRKL